MPDRSPFEAMAELCADWRDDYLASQERHWRQDAEQNPHAKSAELSAQNAAACKAERHRRIAEAAA